MNILLISSLVIILTIIIFKKFFVIIKARTFAIVERLGQFNRVLYPGAHFILYPFEYLKTVRWSFRGQNMKNIYIETDRIYSENSQMDVPPYKCITNDQIEVIVDGIVLYSIPDPKKAVYETHNLLNYVEQVLQQAVHNIIKGLNSKDIDGNANQIGQDIINYSNEKLKNGAMGIVLKEYVIQTIEIDPEIRKANQDIYVRSRKAELELDASRFEHEKRLKDLEFKKIQMEEELKNKREAVRFELEMGREQYKQEYEKVLPHIQKLKDMGFSNDEIVELERAKGFSQLAASDNQKTVLAPLEYFTKKGILFKE